MEYCERYLGLEDQKLKPSRIFRRKLPKKLLGWKEKFISKAGREVLIKTIVQTIPTYSMSIFKIPTALCNIINSSLAKYWWVKQRMRRKFTRLTRRSCVL